MKSLITIVAIIALRFQSFCQQPIFVNTNKGDLYSLNLTNCSSSLIGSTGHVFGDIAFTSDGQLWGIEGGYIYKIDRSNAVSTLIGYTGLNYINSLVSLNDATLLTVDRENNLYSISIYDASTHLLGNIGYGSSGDLTWYDNDLFMTSDSLLIKIVFNNNFTEILSSSPVNKGVLLIPPDYGFYGAVTAPFKNSSNLLIGFSGRDAYKICQIDGTFQLLCSGIVPDIIYGGACITLAPQNPQPTTCFAQKTQLPLLIRIRNVISCTFVKNKTYATRSNVEEKI